MIDSIISSDDTWTLENMEKTTVSLIEFVVTFFIDRMPRVPYQSFVVSIDQSETSGLILRPFAA